MSSITTVYLNPDLKRRAKQQKINISQLLTQALIAKLNESPNQHGKEKTHMPTEDEIDKESLKQIATQPDLVERLMATKDLHGVLEEYRARNIDVRFGHLRHFMYKKITGEI